MSRLPIPLSSKSALGTSSQNRTFNRQSSGIPVSTRKSTNLYTPKDKKTTSYYSASTISKQSFTTAQKYQRHAKPAPDRDEQNRMFERLVTFLKDNGYQSALPEAKRFFLAVSSSEASRIFEFLLRFSMPDFKINKLEEDVPAALTKLSYPYIKSVTKSSLVSIATRQSACNLLLIYDWLVKVAQFLLDRYEEDFEVEIQPGLNAEGLPVEELVDLCTEYDPRVNKEQVFALLEKYLGTEEDVKALKVENQRIGKEWNEKHEKDRRFRESHAEVESLLENIEKYKEYNEKLKQYAEYQHDQAEKSKKEFGELQALAKSPDLDQLGMIKKDFVEASKLFKLSKNCPPDILQLEQTISEILTLEQAETFATNFPLVENYDPQGFEDLDQFNEKLRNEMKEEDKRFSELSVEQEQIKASIKKTRDEENLKIMTIEHEHAQFEEQKSRRKQKKDEEISNLKANHERRLLKKKEEETLYKKELICNEKEIKYRIERLTSQIHESEVKHSKDVIKYKFEVDELKKFDEMKKSCKPLMRRLSKRGKKRSEN